MKRKLCGMCGKRRSINMFHRDAARKDGRYPNCRDCKSVSNTTTYAKHRPARLAKAAAYREANRDVINECHKSAYRRNRKQRLQYVKNRRMKFPDNERAIAKRYRQNHPDRILDRCHARRAKKISNGQVDRISRKEVWLTGGQRCYLCREKLAFADMQLEHKIPICRGGTHTRDNVAAACKTCNQQKGQKTPQEYASCL